MRSLCSYLSLYSHSLDQIAEGVLANSFCYSLSQLDYPEIYGREIEFTVTDLRGTQTFVVTQNASGVWSTFPVVGDAENPITVQAFCRQSNHRPAISALAFDPFEDRRVFLEYTDGRLSKTIQPTSDPEREVATE